MPANIPKTMRAVVVYEPGDPEVLKLEELPVPTPKAGEVLIKVMAAGVNRSEMFSECDIAPSRRSTLTQPSQRVKATRQASSSRAFWGSKRPGLSQRARMAPSRPANASSRRCPDLGVHMMVVMPNIRLCRRAQPDVSARQACRGMYSARSPRCCRQHGAVCTKRSVSKRATVC
jgi:hypothetical protein